MNVKRIDIKEFRANGFLQEVNRQFLHPLGLALEVIIDEKSNESLGGIWDYRGDPEGIIFAKNTIKKENINYVKKLRDSKSKKRIEILGSVIQKR